MTTLRSIHRLLTLGLATSVVIVGCASDGSETDSAGATDGSSSTGDSATTATTQTTQTTQTSQTGPTTGEPTGGSMSATGTGSTTEDEPTGTTANVSATDTQGGTETSTEAVCGDNMQEGTEECDDGNQVDGDGCEANCTNTAVCGNGTIEAGEACDDSNVEDGDECSADCTVATPMDDCGDGAIQDPEQCDDGNDVEGDGCEPNCTITPAECGNNKVEVGEDCDDGNDVNGGPGDFCKNNCTVFIPANCGAPAMYANCDDNINLGDKLDPKNALRSIGICDGELATSVVSTDFTFESLNPLAWQVAKGFGSYTFDHDMDAGTPDQLLYSPREGSTFLMMSTGVIKPPNGMGVVVEGANSQVNNAGNLNNGDNALPPPFKVAVGSANGAGGTPFQQCDGVNDCSDTLQAQWLKGNQNPNDRSWFSFKTTVPPGTFGYTFDFVFCSSEWPAWVDTQYNDLLIAYQVDPTVDDPQADPPVDAYSGNVTFVPDPLDDKKGLPLTITALDPYLEGPGYSLLEPQLAGTGFENHACSDWFKAKGGVRPGAEVTIGFYLADMGDTALATVALLDNFRWDCEGCVPSEVDDCGIQGPM